MFHTIIIAGNVGRDAQMRYTPSGQAVAQFSVATNRQYNNSQGEQVKETIWFNISAWGRMAEVCNQFVKKGMKVLVEGRLTADKDTGRPRVWSGEDGVARASFEVSAATVKFLSRSEHDNGADMPAEVHGNPSEAEPVTPEDDIPF
jgi:single-strand DNA-binding protein